MTFDSFSYTRILAENSSDFKKDALEIRSGSIVGVNYENVVLYDSRADEKKQNFLSIMKRKFTQDIPSGILFPAVRYSAPGLLVFERPPTNKMIEYVSLPVDVINEENFEESVHTYNLPLPWQLYVAEYDPNTMRLFRVHMYFMKESLKASDQIMYLPPLPNFYANGNLCRPFLANMDDIERYSKDLSGVMASAYDWIWNSGFNHDLMEGPLTIYHHKNNTFYDSNYVRTPATSSWQRYLHPKDVTRVLANWEKFTLDSILTVEWPNLSVCNLWDSEVEWFFEHDPEYPYNYQDYPGYDEFEYYNDDYPIRSHDLKKNFKIMITSVVYCNENDTRSNRHRSLGHHQRFTTYHKSAV